MLIVGVKSYCEKQDCEESYCEESYCCRSSIFGFDRQFLVGAFG